MVPCDDGNTLAVQWFDGIGNQRFNVDIFGNYGLIYGDDIVHGANGVDLNSGGIDDKKHMRFSYYLGSNQFWNEKKIIELKTSFFF